MNKSTSTCMANFLKCPLSSFVRGQQPEPWPSNRPFQILRLARSLSCSHKGEMEVVVPRSQ